MPRKSPATAVSLGPLPAPPTIYQVKITLLGGKPPIWRRVEVPNISLESLHAVIQIVLPWDSSHLWEFAVNRDERYGMSKDSDYGFDMDNGSEPATGVTLEQLVARNVKKFLYTYDFGDSWEHRIDIEKVLPGQPGVRYPRLVDGKRAGPPEDCGGIWGYARLLEVLGNPKHPEHREMKEWHGGTIDPEAFDLEGLDRIVGKLAKGTRRPK